jgi:hypothetical protein
VRPNQTETNSKISRPAPPELASLVPLIARFHRIMEQQKRRDIETIESLNRSLYSPRCDTKIDAAGRTGTERFADFVRSIVKQELLDSKRS